MQKKKVERPSPKVHIWPDSALTRTCDVITEFDSKLGDLIIDMFLTMRELGGIGLAAPQVGKLQRVLVYKTSTDEGVMINPEITKTWGDLEPGMEGCLSLPGLEVKVERFPSIQVKFQDPDGMLHTVELEGITARCIQHEVDHLDGKTMLSHLSKLKRDMITKKYLKVQKRYERIQKQLNQR